MSNWIDVIKMEIEMINAGELLEPYAEASSDDHVVGDLDDDLKKIYTLALRWDKAAIEMLVSARYVNDDMRRKQDLEKASELRRKSELLMDIFWVSIKDSFELWKNPSIGIRKGWKVVWSDANPIPPILGILGDLFGPR